MRHFVQELEHLQNLLLEMAGLVEAAVRRSVLAYVERMPAEARTVLESETRINELEMEIDDLAVQLLALQQPMATDLRLITAAIKINTDLERMGDMAASIASRAIETARVAPIRNLVDIPRMAQFAESMVRESLDAFVQRNPELARSVLRSDDHVDTMAAAAHRDIIEYMQHDPDSIPRAVDLLLISRRLERIADHATNIAEDTLFLISGVDVRHRVGG